MAHYLMEVGYTSEAWRNLINKPEDRTSAIRPIIEKLGGKLQNAYFAFGEYDLIIIAEFPDNISAASFSLAGAAGGAVRAFKTTPLLAISEGMDAMKRASNSGYRPPGK
jgi:uncharacterized protein with GYD domain